MKRIKDIRETYNLVTEKEQSDISKLTSLVRAGLFDAKKINIIKRALEKNPADMTLAERKILIELLESLMSEVLHSQQVYSRVKQNVMSGKEKMNEASKDSYLTKFDPRMTKYPSESDIPAVLILKRKAIRIYPDNQKVALYYAQAIDKYVSIPYGNINTSINESEKNKDDSISNVPINTLFGDPDKEKKAKEYIDRSNLPLSSRLGVKAGLWLRKKFGKQASGSKGDASGEKGSKTEPTTKQSDKVIPTKKFKKRKNPVAGTGEQPTGAFKFAEPSNKTKTLSYSSTVAPARKITPLEKSSGKTDDKKQLPRKRLGFDPKVPGTGAQPTVGKTNIRAAFKKKLSEGKKYPQANDVEINEALPLIAGAVAAGRAIIGAGSSILARRAAAKAAAKAAKPKPKVRPKPKTTTKPKAGGVTIGVNDNSDNSDTSDTATPEKKYTEPQKAFSLSARISDPTVNKLDPEVARNRRRESQYDKSLAENVVKQLYTIKESYNEGFININNDSITVHKNIAEKVINVYESLNKENQKKVNTMLNESVDSFKKIINFAVRQ